MDIVVYPSTLPIKDSIRSNFGNCIGLELVFLYLVSTQSTFHHGETWALFAQNIRVDTYAASSPGVMSELRPKVVRHLPENAAMDECGSTSTFPLLPI